MSPKLSTFLEEPAGSFSVTRLVFALTMITFLAIYGYVSIRNKQFQPIPSEVITWIGIVSAQRAIQRFAENQDPSLKPPFPPSVSQ